MTISSKCHLVYLLLKLVHNHASVWRYMIYMTMSLTITVNKRVEFIEFKDFNVSSCFIFSQGVGLYVSI